MKNYILSLILIMSIPTVVVPQKVEIDQETANKCSRCFDEVAALRDAVAKLEGQGKADKATIDSLNMLINFYAKNIDSQDKEIVELRRSIRELMEYIIKRPTKKCNGFIVLGC